MWTRSSGWPLRRTSVAYPDAALTDSSACHSMLEVARDHRTPSKGLDMAIISGFFNGALAGAAGTTALNAVTYLDMVLRARPSSSTPETTVKKLSEKTDVTVPGNSDERGNRIAGLGPLLGIATGMGVGALMGAAWGAGVRTGPVPAILLATAGAMAGSMLPMAALGVTDPRTWKGQDWISDVVPHLAYGAVTAHVLEHTRQL